MVTVEGSEGIGETVCTEVKSSWLICLRLGEMRFPGRGLLTLLLYRSEKESRKSLTFGWGVRTTNCRSSTGESDIIRSFGEASSFNL